MVILQVKYMYVCTFSLILSHLLYSQHSQYTLYVTRYEKRDRLGYLVNFAFLAWIVTSISVESNGTSYMKKICVIGQVISLFLHPGRPSQEINFLRNGRFYSVSCFSSCIHIHLCYVMTSCVTLIDLLRALL